MGRKSKAQKEQEKRMHSLTLYVIFSLAALIVYTIVEQVLSTVTGFTNDTLTTVFFAAFGGEVLVAGLIKIFKLKNEKEENIDEMAG